MNESNLIIRNHFNTARPNFHIKYLIIQEIISHINYLIIALYKLRKNFLYHLN
jgi:hypothetical protein